MKRKLLLLFFIFLMISPIGSAEDKVKVTGDSIKGDTEKKITYINGNVKIIQEDNIILTDKAKIDLNQKLLFLEGNVKFDNNEVVIEAKMLDYDMRKKTGTFSEKVILKRIEKKETGKGCKEPFSLYADQLYFESKTKNFTATNGKIEHRDFTGKAILMEYNDKKEELLLKGDTYLKRPNGEEVFGKETKINLKDKSFVVTDQVAVKFEVEEEEN